MIIDDVKNICVIGSGTMGSQIAMQCALHGYNVSLNDVDGTLLTRAIEQNKGHLQRRVEKQVMTEEQVQEALERITCTTDLVKAASDADFVIEAVVEKLEIKRDVFSKLDRICPDHTIFATNSSYLGNSLIASATHRADRVVNMHFFHPVLVMKLVEVVQGEQTSEETMRVTVELAQKMAKVPVTIKKELPGFLVNRILMAIRREAFSLLEQGVASFEDIDTAC